MSINVQMNTCEYFRDKHCVCHNFGFFKFVKQIVKSQFDFKKDILIIWDDNINKNFHFIITPKLFALTTLGFQETL